MLMVERSKRGKGHCPRHGTFGFFLPGSQNAGGELRRPKMWLLLGKRISHQLTRLIALINERNKTVFSLLEAWYFFSDSSLSLMLVFARPGDHFICSCYCFKHLLIYVHAFTHASCLASFSLDICISRLIHIPVFLS